MLMNTQTETIGTLVVTLGPKATPGLQTALTDKDFSSWTAAGRYDFFTLLSLRQWSLVVVDLVQSLSRNLERCLQIRKMYSGPMVIIWPGAGTDQQREILESGIDDILSWPQPGELFRARLRNIVGRIHRAQPAVEKGPGPLQLDGVLLDPSRREIRRDGRAIPLTQRELELLQVLARNLGQPVTRDSLFEELRGFPYDGLDRSIDLRVSRLRRKLGDDNNHPRIILTVRGVGYQLAAQALA